MAKDPYLNAVTFDDVASTSSVRRYHLLSTSKDQDLAAHQYRVTLFAVKILYKLADMIPDKTGYLLAKEMAVLQYGLVHDIDEIYSGDVPSVTKIAVGRVNFEVVGRMFWEKRGVPELKPDRVVKNVVKVADILDGYIFAFANVGKGPGDTSAKRMWVLDGWREVWSNAAAGFDPEIFTPQVRETLRVFVFGECGGVDLMHC